LGVEGIEEKQFDEIRDVLFQTLEDVKKNGIDQSLIEETLHKQEFSAKRTRSRSGLMYIQCMVPFALHGGDPLDLFRISEFCDRLRDDYAKGGFFEALIEKHMLKNPHYLELKYVADPTIADKKEQAKLDQLKDLEQSLTEA